ncbi:hypothetical protein CP533_4554 [Ophiocordyceps camponoti-saundersi (nom. inval.)]|nr:hypothetical protein CP533_4554 [Ophiocordyceps camponoti-saundersi (nom. inval.)]
MVSLKRLLIASLITHHQTSKATPIPEQQQSQEAEIASFGRTNDWSCRSASHKPVVLLHGLFASDQIELNVFEKWLRGRGYCTFALVYGSYTPLLPVLAGIKPIAQSSGEIASFVAEVRRRTGAEKVDVVGHSEGAFQALYAPKFQPGFAQSVDSIVAIAPPTHGTDISGLYKLAYLLGNLSREVIGRLLEALGCAACNDLGPGGPAVVRLNDGRPIVQPGNAVTIITSRNDEIVTPPSTAFVNEPGVRNLYVQDYCPQDRAGHLGEAYDANVWNLAVNALDRQFDRKFACTKALPIR